MKNENIKIAPSILSADFAKMASEVESMEKCGADMIHCDVMDGVFVPNITFGIKMVKDIRSHTKLPLDCHLMIVNPEKYVEAFSAAGADYITVHYEACRDCVLEVLKAIKSRNVKAGLAINPDTDVKFIEEFLPECDLVLVMSVFPGFAGQSFIDGVLDKVKYLRSVIDEKNLNCLIEIDGGINAKTALLSRKAGADILVSGSSVFNESNRKKAIADLR